MQISFMGSPDKISAGLSPFVSANGSEVINFLDFGVPLNTRVSIPRLSRPGKYLRNLSCAPPWVGKKCWEAKQSLALFAFVIVAI
jgi:hypothetical protein